MLRQPMGVGVKGYRQLQREVMKKGENTGMGKKEAVAMLIRETTEEQRQR